MKMNEELHWDLTNMNLIIIKGLWIINYKVSLLIYKLSVDIIKNVFDKNAHYYRGFSGREVV